MDTFDKISRLIEQNGITQADLARATGISTGLISQWKKRTQKPSAEKLALVADYFGVSVDYLMGVEKEKPTLTMKDERDIARTLEAVMNDLDNSGDLMFDGDPMTDEARESIKAAMKLGLEAAKLKNKERFTPKKFRKE